MRITGKLGNLSLEDVRLHMMIEPKDVTIDPGQPGYLAGRTSWHVEAAARWTSSPPLGVELPLVLLGEHVSISGYGMLVSVDNAELLIVGIGEPVIRMLESEGGEGK